MRWKENSMRMIQILNIIPFVVCVILILFVSFGSDKST